MQIQVLWKQRWKTAKKIVLYFFSFHKWTNFFLEKLYSLISTIHLTKNDATKLKPSGLFAGNFKFTADGNACKSRGKVKCCVISLRGETSNMLKNSVRVNLFIKLCASVILTAHFPVWNAHASSFYTNIFLWYKITWKINFLESINDNNSYWTNALILSEYFQFIFHY